MLLPKKTIALILGASAIGGGVVAYKYLTSSSSEDIQLQRNKEKEAIEKAHNLALKICKLGRNCDMERTKKILDENKDLKFDFQIA